MSMVKGTHKTPVPIKWIVRVQTERHFVSYMQLSLRGIDENYDSVRGQYYRTISKKLQIKNRLKFCLR